MYGVLLTLLIICSIFLVIFILMQSDKGGGLAGSLGGMGAGGLPFSGREAATILSKLTTGLAIAFMVICVVLSILSRNRAGTANDSALAKRASQVHKMESQSASSVLDQNLPASSAPNGQNTLPPSEASSQAAPASKAPAASQPLFPAK